MLLLNTTYIAHYILSHFFPRLHLFHFLQIFAIYHIYHYHFSITTEPARYILQILG